MSLWPLVTTVQHPLSGHGPTANLRGREALPVDANTEWPLTAERDDWGPQ